MDQWEDDTLVAIKSVRNGQYKVMELPARQTTIITYSKPFNDYEQAEQFIEEQYSTAITVPVEDIEEEVQRRVHKARQVEESEENGI